MKKSEPHVGSLQPWSLRKILLVMKLIVILLTVSVLQAKAFNANSQSITVNVKQTEIRKILNDIERQSDFRFLYNYDLTGLRKKIDIAAYNVSLKDVLDKILDGNGLNYKVLNNNLVVILSKNEEENREIRITGKITGYNDEPLAGVTVQEKGTNNGTTTDNSGSYSLTVANNAVLVISYIGYESQEISVGGQSIINVKLVAAIKQMDQVVVVGYGTQRKRELTGAVSVVNAADIANRPIVNTAEALQGKAAGVQVTSVSGKPGAGLSIRIRGSSSISAGNEPLYVVDGIPMSDISTYSPNDIESISVLKDAASASIYGTRAANGVVVITTKKGRAGKSKIEFNTYFGTSSPTNNLDVLDSRQYQEYMNEVFGPGTISDSLVQATNVNWPDEIFRTGNQKSYQVAFSGGSDKTQHYVSLGYMDQVGAIRPATFDRINARFNLSSKLNNWLSITTATTISRANTRDVTDNNSVARGGVVLSALTTPPTVPEYRSDGTIGQNPQTGWENPLGAIEGSTNKFRQDRIVSNIGADIRFLPGFVFQSRFGIDYKNNLNQFFTDPWLTQNGRNNQGNLSQQTSTEFAWLSEQTLNYSKSFNQHNFAVLLGWSAQESRYDQTNIGASKLDTQYRHQEWEEMFLRSQIKSDPSKSIDEWGLVSYFGRVNYNFAGRYLLQANLRVDKSSKFAPDNRTATFPSFSAGWRISEEKFMNDVSFVQDLKLRAGWGKNGNQEGIGSYEYLSLSNINNTTGDISPATIAPEDLRWETTTQSNIGIDASFLNRRITFTADFYVKKTEDVLVRIPLSGQIVPSVLLNSGSMQNVGQEFMISSKNITKKDFSWTTDFNISFNKNKVTSIGNDLTFLGGFGEIYERGFAIALAKDYGLGQFFGYTAAGVDPATGQQLYLTKDKVAVPYTGTSPSDRSFIGSAQPKFVYGMTNWVTYKNFDLTVFLQGSQGNKIFNGARVETEGMKDSRNQSADILNRWRNPGDVTDMPGVSIASNDNTAISTRFLEDGSYLRFKTITLAYRISPKLLEKIGINDASIYVSGQNLITFTKYTGFDPEVSTYGGVNNNSDNRNVSLGVDYGAYPQMKVFLFGINISL
jgi:TonB-dependent starch-binding outer membrane protein SusC